MENTLNHSSLSVYSIQNRIYGKDLDSQQPQLTIHSYIDTSLSWSANIERQDTTSSTIWQCYKKHQKYIYPHIIYNSTFPWTLFIYHDNVNILMTSAHIVPKSITFMQPYFHINHFVSLCQTSCAARSLWPLFSTNANIYKIKAGSARGAAPRHYCTTASLYTWQEYYHHQRRGGLHPPRTLPASI